VRAIGAGLVAALAIAAPLAAQGADSAKKAPPPPLDGYNVVMRDTLLDHLAGSWRATRRMGTKSTASQLDVAWILNHQFLQLHYRDTSASGYEAMVFIGYDHTSERYVAHWFDIGGARWSETLGYGKPVPHGVEFLFEYPDGPFTNRFTFDAATGEWSALLRQKNAQGVWTTFAEERIQRR
jgi:hypothetical protein